MINILLNGKNLEIKHNSTLEDFVNEFLPKDKFAIEVDLCIIPRSEYSTFHLQDGMKIEVITFVGGG
jgi:sulfur carrier protein